MDINVKTAIEAAIKSNSFAKYAKIINLFNTIDVSQSRDFQKAFNGFYRVRRGEEWQKVYYQLFEKYKNETPTFAEIITQLYKQTGNIEASFSSKMLHTLNCNMPIWDRYVLEKLGKNLKGKTKKERLENAIKIYNEVCEWYCAYLKTQEAEEYISNIDGMLEQYQWFSKTKKIDFLLWQSREN